MPQQVEWLVTLEGNALAFPSCIKVVKGERCTLPDDEAARALTAKLAKPVGKAKAKEK